MFAGVFEQREQPTRLQLPGPAAVEDGAKSCQPFKPVVNACSSMIDPTSFKQLRLRGGCVIAGIQFTPEPMVDALGREAIAQTRILGRYFHLLIRTGLSDRELSISLYHEILEAASVASPHPPAGVLDFNEGDFEQAGRAAHDRLGDASAENLNLMLQSHGFPED